MRKEVPGGDGRKQTLPSYIVLGSLIRALTLGNALSSSSSLFSLALSSLLSIGRSPRSSTPKGYQETTSKIIRSGAR